MRGHPDIMPGEHRDRDAEDQSVEQLLPHAGKSFRHFSDEDRDKARADEAPKDSARDPLAAAGHSFRRRHHDADDNSGFDDFAKNNDQGGKHVLFLSSLISRSARPD